VFARGLQVHLRESRQDLSALPADAGEERAMLIMHMIQQNRLFERAAEQNDAGDLARVLRAFEPILMRLAANDMTPEDAEALQAQLAFELNVMLTKLGKSASESTGPI
jgi:DNA-binding FadR family transcriptional regulator